MTESKQPKLTTKTCHRNFSQNSGYVEYNFVGFRKGPNNEKYYFCSNQCYKTFAILHCTFITYLHSKSSLHFYFVNLSLAQLFTGIHMKSSNNLARLTLSLLVLFCHQCLAALYNCWYRYLSCTLLLIHQLPLLFTYILPSTTSWTTICLYSSFYFVP